MSEGDTNLRAGRGQHRPCRILARCRKMPYPARLTEMEKWSWIRIRNPISTKIELVLQVHPLVPPTKFGGDPWTRSWDILRTKTVRNRHTDTRRWPQDLAAYGAQVNIVKTKSVFTSINYYKHVKHVTIFMCKHGLCCRPVSVRLCLMFVYCIQTAEDIITLSWHDSPIILVFSIHAPLSNSMTLGICLHCLSHNPPCLGYDASLHWNSRTIFHPAEDWILGCKTWWCKIGWLHSLSWTFMKKYRLILIKFYVTLIPSMTVEFCPLSTKV